MPRTRATGLETEIIVWGEATSGVHPLRVIVIVVPQALRGAFKPLWQRTMTD